MIKRTFALLLLFLCPVIVSSTKVCPANCTCGIPDERDIYRARTQEEVVNCAGKGFHEIPYWDIPCDALVIDFSQNNLKKLTRSSFRGLQQLEYIYLRQNQIDYMETATFAGLPNLKDVILTENNFDEIDERPFWDGAFANLMVQLDGNPFFCDKQLKRTFFQIEHKVSLSGIYCKDGERRRPVMRRNDPRQVKGEYFYEAEDIIRNRHFSWEIALIGAACWAFTWLCILLMYFCWNWDEGKPRKKVVREMAKVKSKSMSKARQMNDQNGRLEFEMYDEYDGERIGDGQGYYPEMATAEVDDRYFDDRMEPYDELRPPSPRDPVIEPAPYRTQVRHAPLDHDDDSHFYSQPRRSGREPDYKESLREDSYFPNSRQGQRDFERPRGVPEEVEYPSGGGRAGGGYSVPRGGNEQQANDEFDI